MKLETDTQIEVILDKLKSLKKDNKMAKKQKVLASKKQEEVTVERAMVDAEAHGHTPSEVKEVSMVVEAVAVQEKMFDYKELPTDIFGLKFRPSIDEATDQLDWYPYARVNGKMVDLSYKHQLINPEFSSRNKAKVAEVMDDLMNRDMLNSILEIGVNRSGAESSTRVILNKKPQNVKYFGIDLNEGNLSSLRNNDQNVFCLATNSSNTEEIMTFCRDRSVEEFSLIFLDGFHSVNQTILTDFLFVKYLTVGGVLLVHDTNFHPTQILFDAIDESIFEKQKCFENVPDDWGMISAKRLK